MKENYVLIIKGEDRPGLLHLITGVLNRKLIRIISLTAAPTDIRDIVLITLEIEISEEVLQPLLYKLENIIEVFAVEAIAYDKVLSMRVACFKVNKSFLGCAKLPKLQQYSAVIVNWYPDSVIIAMYGTDAAIRRLYNELEGPHLIGFSQTVLITESKLIGEDQSSVISMAA